MFAWLRRWRQPDEAPAPTVHPDTGEQEIMELLAAAPVDAEIRPPSYLDGAEEAPRQVQEQSKFLEIRDEDLEKMAENEERALGSDGARSGLGRGLFGPLMAGVLRPWRGLPGPVRMLLGAALLMFVVFGVLYPFLSGQVGDWAGSVIDGGK